MYRKIYTSITCIAVCLLACSSYAQDWLGTPNYRPQIAINSILSIDPGSMNINVHVPVMGADSGGPLPLSAEIGFNVQLFNNVVNKYDATQLDHQATIGTPYDQGALLVSVAQQVCYTGGPTTTKYAFLGVQSANGTFHPFIDNSVPLYYQYDSMNCLYPPNNAFLALDDSGYSVVVNGPGQTFQVYSAGGNYSTVTPNGGPGPYQLYSPITDPHGNTINVAYAAAPADTTISSPLNPSGTWIKFLDPQTNPNGTTTHVRYNDSSGTQHSETLSYQTKTFNPTTFSCSGISIQSGSSRPPGTLTYGDGSTASFTWETNGGSGITGRLASVKTREGGTWTFTYSGGSGGSGIWCPATPVAAGTPIALATIQIVAPDGGIWKIDRGNPNPTTGAFTTTVTKPDLTYTQYFYQGQAYNGTRNILDDLPTSIATFTSSGVLQKETWICYNGDTISSSCGTLTKITQAAFQGVNEVTYWTLIPGVTKPDTGSTCSVTLTNGSYSGCAKETDITYDTLGNPLVTSEFGFGPVLLRKTTTCYGNGASCTPFTNQVGNKPGKIVVTDGSGTTVSQTVFNYDSTGNLTSKVDYASATNSFTTNYTPNTNGTVQKIVNPDGTQVVYAYANCNGLLPSSATYGNASTNIGSESFTYECADGLPTAVTDMNGLTYNYAYIDNLFRLTQITDNNGDPAINISYPSVTTVLTSQIDSTNGWADIREVQTDTTGRVITDSVEESNGGQWDTVGYIYNTTNTVFGISQPCTVATGTTQCPITGTLFTKTAHSYTYDSIGRMKGDTLSTDAGNATTTYTYNGPDVLSSLSPAYNTSTQVQKEYDGLGRVKSICVGNSGLTGSGSCGQTTAMTGYLTTFSYDGASRLLSTVKNAQGTTTQTTTANSLDWLGRPASITSPFSGTTTFTYDTTGADCSSLPSGTEAKGKVTEIVDAKGNKNCSQYETVGGRIQENQVVAGPDYGNCDNGCVRFWAYDGAGNAAGRLRIALGDTTQGSGANYTPDIYYSYDKLGRVNQLEYVYEGSNGGPEGAVTISSTYFANGALASLTGVPNGTAAGCTLACVGSDNFSFTVDGKGRPYSATDTTTATSIVSSVTYDNQDRPLTTTYATGDSDVYTYDTLYGMKSFVFNVGSNSDSGTYTWGANGVLTGFSRTSTVFSGDNQTCTYTHDDLGQILTNNCGTKFNDTYSYDEMGNVTASGSSIYAPGYDKTNNHEQNGMTYDANGQILSDVAGSGTTLTWNPWHLVRTSSSTGYYYDYAADGTIAGKQDGSIEAPNVWQYYSSPTGAFLGEVKYTTSNLVGKATGIAVPLPGGGMFNMNLNNLTLLHHNMHEDVVLETNFAARTGKLHWSYGPFGERYGANGNIEGDFGGEFQFLDIGFFGNHEASRKRSLTPPYVGNNSPY